MKRNICLILAAMLCLLTACGTTPSAGAENAPAPSAETAQETPAEQESEETTDTDEGQTETVDFTDALNRSVSVPVHPRRVATLIGSFADIWCLAGGKETLAATADDTWTSFDLGLADTVVNLGAIKEPNVEALLAAEPELVIASANTTADVELLDTLEQAGVNVVYFNVSSFEDYLNMLELCTRMTGATENYETYGTAVEGQVNEARAMVNGSEPSVLYIRATGTSVKVKNSEDSVLGEMLRDLGCRNIADSDTGLLEELSMEAILADDPQMIFIVVQGSDPEKAETLLDETVLSNPAWQQLGAVQSGQVVYMDPSLYNLKPNERWGEAYEKLAQILYGSAD